MKKLMTIVLLGSMLTMSSCGTYTGQGALVGAEIGGVVGSLFGGISGGWRGSDVGQLVGMAGGAAVGAAVGSAADQKRNERLQQADEVYQQRKAQQRQRENVRYQKPQYIDGQTVEGKIIDGQYVEGKVIDRQYVDSKDDNVVYDDRIDFDAPGPQGYKPAAGDTIREIHFKTRQ